MRRLLLLLPLLLVACDEPAPIDTAISEQYGAPSESVKQVSCEHPGLCAKCGMTLKMKFECSASFWRNCPGHQDARVRVTPVAVTFKSGRVEQQTRESIVERIGSCK